MLTIKALSIIVLRHFSTFISHLCRPTEWELFFFKNYRGAVLCHKESNLSKKGEHCKKNSDNFSLIHRCASTAKDEQDGVQNVIY